MSILVNAETRLIVQGMTGRAGTFYTDLAMRYGTQVVGGVRPGKGGSRHLGLPVFDDVRQAVAETGANASLVLVPPHNAAAAILEAIDAEVGLVVCVTERVPVLDMVRVRAALSGSKTELLGPNSQGILAPGVCKIGVMSTANAVSGQVGIASRSASLTSEIVAATSDAGLGLSTTVGVGGDPIHGVGFRRCLELFRDDPETAQVVLIGEIGGSEEEDAAAYLRSVDYGKPVSAIVVGRHAPAEKRMGHAGTLSALQAASAEEKIRLLREAGVEVEASPAALVARLKAASKAPETA